MRWRRGREGDVRMTFWCHVVLKTVVEMCSWTAHPCHAAGPQGREAEDPFLLDEDIHTKPSFLLSGRESPMNAPM